MAGGAVVVIVTYTLRLGLTIKTRANPDLFPPLSNLTPFRLRPLVNNLNIRVREPGFGMKQSVTGERHLPVSHLAGNPRQQVRLLVRRILAPSREVHMPPGIRHILLQRPRDAGQVTIQRPFCLLRMAVRASALQHGKRASISRQRTLRLLPANRPERVHHRRCQHAKRCKPDEFFGHALQYSERTNFISTGIILPARQSWLAEAT